MQREVFLKKSRFLFLVLILASVLGCQIAAAAPIKVEFNLICPDFLENRIRSAGRATVNAAKSTRRYFSLKASKYKSPTEHRAELARLTRLKLMDIFPNTTSITLP